MAQLIQMRQRIKAIETIKKITHAMRLISMSNHSRLKGKETPLINYATAINNLFISIKQQTPTWNNPLVYPTAPAADAKTLIVLVGSQKGLCGNFNTSLFKYFEHEMSSLKPRNPLFVAVGRKSIDFLEEYIVKKPGSILHFFPDFSSSNLFVLAKTLTLEILYPQHMYENAYVLGNQSKTFFLQRPQTHMLIPFAPETAATVSIFEDYVWEQDPHALLDTLLPQSIEAALQSILFQSLLAEQSARFLSMDSSTRNAENLLEITELHYNKLRQAKITKELTELTGSF